MTDTWGEAIERLKAAAALSAAPEAGPGAAPVAGPETGHAPPPSSWPLYATPSPDAPQASDPLILELEHDGGGHGLAAEAPVPVADPPSSVFGRVEALAPEPASHELTHLEAQHAPIPSAPVPVEPVHLEAAPAEPDAPAVEPVVAQAEKPVEPAPHPADPVPLVAPAHVAAPVVVADAAPQPARPILTEVQAPHPAESHSAIDPVLAGFDHIVALAGYVLLFISVFMFGVPALATMALAYAHKNDSHLLVRSHYRFQLRIFWTAVLFALLAIGSAVTAGGLAVTKLIQFIRDQLPGVGAAMDQAHVSSWSGQIAGILVIAAVTLGLLAVVWTLIASVFGFLRLISNRPIGHQYAGK